MQRFEGIQKIYGTAAERLFKAHVLIVGLGGVGSWTAEALARSGVGALTLVDPDEICVSNINRQIQAMDGVIGRAKVDVLAERIHSIHPGCRVERRPCFFRESNADEILTGPYDFVVDAIDGVMMKARLIALCRDRGWPVITCGGAGGKRDPGQVQCVDLSMTYNDRLLLFVRRKLRKLFDFPRVGPFNVPCVFSPEPTASCAEPVGEGEGLSAEAGSALACEGRLGALLQVTGVVGFFAAAHVINSLTERQAVGGPQKAALGG